MGSLPQEIVDEIIDNLAFDFATLNSASLVQKSWTHRARRRLFYFVPIYSLGRLLQWSLSISPDPDGVASYTRTILLSYDTRRSWIEPANLDMFFDHFRSFTSVERLVISGLESSKFNATSTAHYFGHFTATVQSLQLGTAIGTPASLFSFISAFPLVDDLAIELPSLVGGGANLGEVTRPASVPRFRGKIRLLDMVCESSPLVELLCTLPLHFHTVWVSSRDAGRLPQLAKLVSKCGKTLRSLHIARKTREFSSRLTGASLVSCVALEELRITVTYPMHLTILAEILPTLPNPNKLSRIILDASGRFPKYDMKKAEWSSLDAIMSECAERISTKYPNRRLVLQFRTDVEGAIGEYDKWARDLAGLLVSFPKVGTVEYVAKH